MLLDSLQSDLNQSLKTGDKARTETLRYLLADVKKFDIDTYLPGSKDKLTDADVEKIIRKQVKTHTESIEAFSKAGRRDLVDKETAELKIIKTYLPPEISDNEIRNIVRSVISQGNTNFGPVMGMVMKQLAGKVDGNKVAEVVKAELQK